MQWSSSTLQAFLLLLAIPETLAAPAAAGISLPRNIFGLQRRQTQQNANEQSWIKKWAAVGDSYAAGIGAGNRIDYSCSRYDSSYANLLNSSPRMSGTQTFEFLACSGAKSPDVEKQVAQLSSGYDMITVSSGGNDVGLVDLLNECVYTWNPKIGCEKTIANSKDLIQNTLPKNLDSLYGKLKGKVGQGTVYVTSYGRFFDETSNDCDKVSWHWFTFPVNWLNWQYLTVDRRKAMNELVDLVNEQIRQAVKRAGSQFVVVEWDSAFGTFEGRYCMPGVQEPQPNRDQLMFYLDGTTESSKKKRQNEDGFPEGSFEAQVQGLIKEGQDTIKANMSDSDPKPQSLISLPIPDNWARVFHPLKKGHAIIASKIFFHMAQTRAKQLNIGQGADIVDLSAGTCTIKPPLPSNPAIGTQGELSANFPKYWILGDGKQHDITDMYYRLRDKTCQNICDASAIADVPSQFVRATRVGDEGCAYSVKISNDKELYLYATQDGSNCYQATEQLLTQHGKTKESAWLQTEANYEFYQIGVRDINTEGPGGSKHDGFPADNQHLGYLHLACRRSDGGAWQYNFNLKLSAYEQGDQWGKKLKSELDKCEKASGTDKWQFENEDQSNPYKFKDGSAADNWSYWQFALTISKRCGEATIEKVLGLKENSVQCPNGDSWYEVDMFSK